MFLKNIWIIVIVVLSIGCKQVDRDVGEEIYKNPATGKITDVDQKLGAKSGEEIYKNCSACHGENAEKSALGKSEAIGYWEVVSIVQALEEYKNSTRDRYGMGALMTGQVKGLSSDDIKNVANYIYSLQP